MHPGPRTVTAVTRHAMSAQCATHSVREKKELGVLLATLRLDPAGPVVLVTGRRLDVARTYGANCRGGDGVVPGFGPDALARDGAGAVAKFKNFAASSFGQRRFFCFHFAPPDVN